MTRQALIVEDDPDTARLLAESLRHRGLEPTVLLVGQPAVAWVRTHQPDLVLLDLMLPDIDGYDICRALKLDRRTNLVPLVMVTARTQAEDRVRGLEVGANYYLTKPFTQEQLQTAITEVLAWRANLERQGTEGEVHFQMRSATQYLDELNRLLASLFLFTGLSEFQVNHLILAVRELGTNAIEWGHRNEVERIVTITYRIDPDKVTIVIRDTGAGFDPDNVPHAARPEDPAAHLAVREAMGLRDGGCGILMARGLVDDLQYNATGNEVRLVKYFPLPGKAASGSTRSGRPEKSR
jgi:CheY-like chemotaxis protein/anti-sigma regulatory factor (Ser/Thr protein kinase)